MSMEQEEPEGDEEEDAGEHQPLSVKEIEKQFTYGAVLQDDHGTLDLRDWEACTECGEPVDKHWDRCPNCGVAQTWT